MPISASDIVQYASAETGSSGGVITANPIVSGVKNNVWPDILESERIAGVNKWRKTFFKNESIADSAIAPVIYTPVLPLNAVLQIGIGIDNSLDVDANGDGNLYFPAWPTAQKVGMKSDGADIRALTILGLDDNDAPIQETDFLIGTQQWESNFYYNAVWNVSLASASGSRSVTFGSTPGGNAFVFKGSIGIGKVICFRWKDAGTIKANGILLPDLAPGQSIAVWRRLYVAAGAPVTRPNTLTVQCEEN